MDIVIIYMYVYVNVMRIIEYMYVCMYAGVCVPSVPHFNATALHSLTQHLWYAAAQVIIAISYMYTGQSRWSTVVTYLHKTHTFTHGPLCLSTVYVRMYECMYGAEYSYSTYTDGRNSYSVISLMLTYPLAAKTTSMARPKSAGTNKKYEKWPNQAKYMATFSPKYSLTKHYKRI